MNKLNLKALLAPLAMWLLANTTPGFAEPIKVVFMPPEIKVSAGVCAPHARDDQLVADWTKWSGDRLPRRDPYTVQRDMGRLRDLNATKYEKIITRITELMPTIKPNYTQTDALFDTVKTMIAMGQAEKVRSQRLITTLLQKSDGSPSELNTLADFLIQGNGTDQNRNVGLKLKVEAAYGGNAAAMLDLAVLSQAGQKVENWDIEPEIAVNMAFGALVGVLNTGICDRVGRIAREFDKGTLVVRDPAVSEAWYRFAADLGDTTSAWRVAEYHLESDGIVKNNDTLLKYMKIAADGGVVPAILELGRTYAQGSLIKKDTKKALNYYDIAALAGNQTGLVRKALLLEETSRKSPKDTADYEAVLRELSNSTKPPGWVYTKLSRLIAARQGKWEGGGEVRHLLEKAVANGDSDAKLDLAKLIVQGSPNSSNVAKAANLLTYALENDGKVYVIAELQRLYMCLAPDGPDVKTATYWGRMDKSAGNQTISLQPSEVQALTTSRDPLLVASMQTQALYRRPSAIAIYKRYLGETKNPQEVLNFWDHMGGDHIGVGSATAFLDFKDKVQKGEMGKAHDIIRAAMMAKTGIENTDASLAFARFLLENYASAPESLKEAQAILTPLAENGVGRAIGLLKEIDAIVSDVATDTLSRYQDAMKQRGDMSAQIILADNAADFTTRNQFYQRAISAQKCDFDDSMALANFSARHQNAADARRWLATANYFADELPSRRVKIADSYMALKTPETTEVALSLYKQARDSGEASAYYRLIRYYSEAGNPSYDPEFVSQTFVGLLDVSEVEDLPRQLDSLKRMKPAIRKMVMAKIDIRDLYSRSAAAGQPVAMREFAKILREAPSEAGSSTVAFDWLSRAATAGDPEAMFLISQSYAFGAGVKPSVEQAQSWLKKAAAGGFAEAVRTLALVTTHPEG